MAGLRRTRQTVTASSNAGAVAELPLPMIEGISIRPVKLIVALNIEDAGNDVAVGLSHYRSITAPTVVTDVFDAESVWWHHAFGSEQSWEIDFANFQVELAGPQAITYWNGVASGRSVSVLLYYTSHQMGHLEWAALAANTSFED